MKECEAYIAICNQLPCCCGSQRATAGNAGSKVFCGEVHGCVSDSLTGLVSAAIPASMLYPWSRLLEDKRWMPVGDESGSVQPDVEFPDLGSRDSFRSCAVPGRRRNSYD